MARTRNFGFYPAPGTDYTYGQEPAIARRLNRLGRALHLHLIGISGHRTPQHSVAVGGFANDPHTTGSASDTPGIEGVPETTLRRFGLTRPFPGAAEADHIQLFGAGGGTKSKPHKQGFTLADYWTQGGGKPNLAPIMAAIGMAESGGRIDAESPQNTDGTYDYGWLQINSSHGYDKAKLLSDPVYTARAGVAIERTQGLGAWSTYKSGAYRSFMGQGSGSMPTFGRPRPGGNATTDTGGEADAQFAEYVGLFGTPIPNPLDPFGINPLMSPLNSNPLDIFKNSAKAVKDTADFLKWIAWLFHPKNVLRIVEFTVGFTLMGAGLHTLLAVYKDRPATGAAPRIAQRTKAAAGEAFSMSPPGRALRAKRAASFGKRKVRSDTRAVESQAASKKAQREERKRIARKTQKRDVRAARYSRTKTGRKKDDVPF